MLGGLTFAAKVAMAGLPNIEPVSLMVMLFAVIFGAKAAPGYDRAKAIIHLINMIADKVNADPDMDGVLKVVFVQNYNCSYAEKIIPAADVSEQISPAGTEASGTGNMKLMLNGAVTLGTLDGANVEIHEAVGDDNIILFGMTTPEVSALKRSGYRPRVFYENNPIIRNAIDEMNKGFCGVSFRNITDSLLNEDPYMVLADFESYSQAQKRAEALYNDHARWNQMGLVNIAKAGRFAADRAIREYADNIWHATPVPPAPAADKTVKATVKKPIFKKMR